MKISLYTQRRLRRVLFISFGVMIGILFFSYIENRGFQYISLTILLGFLLGLPVGILEEFIFVNKLKRLSFIYIVIIKGVSYILIVATLFAIIVFIFTHSLGYPIERYIEFIRDGEFLRGIIYTMLVYDFIIVFNQYDRLLGHRVMFLYASGKYQTPVRESRIFMFLDLKSSTHLAETMEKERYFNYINDFFHHIAEPVLRCSAEVYQYVGDEVVFTWKMKHGIKDAHCIRLYFMIKDIIKKNAYKYKSRYGNVPEFKAGVHCGEVITAVVGDIKKELVYNGDVLNTTARIRSACNDFNKDLLISEQLINKLKLPEEMLIENIGEVMLRGKSESVELFSLTKKQLI